MIEVLEDITIGTKYIRLIKWFQGYEVEIYQGKTLIYHENLQKKQSAQKLYDEKVQDAQFNLSQISFAL